MAEVSSMSRGSSSSMGLLRLKKIPDTEIMNSIQMGVRRTVGEIESEPERDLLIQDFMTFESMAFPAKGSITDPPHFFTSFKFLNYAPMAFKCFRGLFDIKTDHFLNSMCSASLRQLENPGASGSIFYLTYDDRFILKTVQQREGDFLLKLLPGYYLNLTQNPKTLLPKFFGFYCYNSLKTSIRIVVMNNLIPSNISISQKYDLKGSTSKRKATQAELSKPLPTYKDLDFLEHHPNGLLLDFDTYNAVATALERDCRVLESFKIIDYSLLVGVHYVDKKPNVKKFTCRTASNKAPTRAIPGRTTSGDEVLLFIGIIDILQSYKFRKKIEHTLKSIIYERDSISVHRPDFYSKRFQNFIVKSVFQPMGKRRSVQKTSVESKASDQNMKHETSPESLVCDQTKTSKEVLNKKTMDETSVEITQPNPEEDEKVKGKGKGSSEQMVEDIELQATNAFALKMNSLYDRLSM